MHNLWCKTQENKVSKQTMGLVKINAGAMSLADIYGQRLPRLSCRKLHAFSKYLVNLWDRNPTGPHMKQSKMEWTAKTLVAAASIATSRARTKSSIRRWSHEIAVTHLCWKSWAKAATFGTNPSFKDKTVSVHLASQPATARAPSQAAPNTKGTKWLVTIRKAQRIFGVHKSNA